MSESGKKNRLVGKWVSDPEDRDALSRFGLVNLEFTIDGWLIYKAQSGGREQEMLLTYRTQNGVLVTDQPLALDEERTRYSFDLAGRLTLLHARQRARFIRAP